MSGRTTEDWLDPGNGVLPSQELRKAHEDGWIDSGKYRIPAENFQPASLDLRVGDTAYSLRCSFLPDDDTAVEEKLARFVIDRISLQDGPALEVNRPYLIPLIERLRLPRHVRGKANPKSSTGRLDVFTRVITDGDYRFDEIAGGYHGNLYLEVVPRSFPIRLRPETSLNQLRLLVGSPRCSDADIREIHAHEPLLLSEGEPVEDRDLRLADGLFLRVGLAAGAANRGVGYQARKNCPPVDLARLGEHEAGEYWDPVLPSRERDSLILDPEEFYLLLSAQTVSIPRFLAAEMAPYDPTAGELRTHYAGFFDPGFGWSEAGDRQGSTAVLEVRAHDVPFVIEHGQRVCKLTFERMTAEPDVLYGHEIGSSYQGQDLTLSKHFRRHGSTRENQLRLVGSG